MNSFINQYTPSFTRFILICRIVLKYLSNNSRTILEELPLQCRYCAVAVPPHSRTTTNPRSPPPNPNCHSGVHLAGIYPHRLCGRFSDFFNFFLSYQERIKVSSQKTKSEKRSLTQPLRTIPRRN